MDDTINWQSSVNRTCYLKVHFTMTVVNSVFMLSVLFTESTSVVGTCASVTSLRTLFLLKPAAMTRLAPSLKFTATSTFTTLAQEAASSSCAHSSSLNSLCRYKPQHRGTEVTPYKNNKHCTTGMASGEVPDGHKMAVQQAHEMGGLHAPTLGEVHIYTHMWCQQSMCTMNVCNHNVKYTKLHLYNYPRYYSIISILGSPAVTNSPVH